MKAFHVRAFNSYGYVWRQRAENGVDWIEVARKDPKPPIATIRAVDLNAAHREAVQRYGRSVFTVELGGWPVTTT